MQINSAELYNTVAFANKDFALSHFDSEKVGFSCQKSGFFR